MLADSTAIALLLEVAAVLLVLPPRRIYSSTGDVIVKSRSLVGALAVSDMHPPNRKFGVRPAAWSAVRLASAHCVRSDARPAGCARMLGGACAPPDAHDEALTPG